MVVVDALAIARGIADDSPSDGSCARSQLLALSTI